MNDQGKREAMQYLVISDGWKLVEQFIIEKLEAAKDSLITCKLEKVESIRERIQTCKSILSFVENTLKYEENDALEQEDV